MKRIFVATLALLFTTVSLFAGGKPEAKQNEKEPVELLVAAAASLTDAMGELLPLYRAKTGYVTVTATYGSSGSLQKQIEQGAPVDVFFSASPKQVKALDDQGLLVAGSAKTILLNSLVLVVPKDSSGIASFADASGSKVTQIALGEPASVPAGQYAMQVFASLGIADAVKAKAVYAKDVRQVLAYVESGEVQAGAVYATDAATSKLVTIAATAPAGSMDPVTYPAAVVKASPHEEEAAKFLAWLSGPEAGAVFAKYGFTLP
jgi:molybdate transport system substrate-binding protein